MTDIKNKVKLVQERFLQKKETLAVAESLTGGLLSSWLSSLPGASKFFLGSLVTYSSFSKQKFLSVPARLLKSKGAVNAEVCRLMAQGIIKKWGSDWALSLTGVAGPGKNTVDPEPGTVFLGLFGPSVQKVERILLQKKNRQDIRRQSAVFALDFLCSEIGFTQH